MMKNKKVNKLDFYSRVILANNVLFIQKWDAPDKFLSPSKNLLGKADGKENAGEWVNQYGNNVRIGMGEAKRRKKLDPNYGKLQKPDLVLIKTWENFQPIIIFRDQDKDGKGGDVIAYGSQGFESFNVAIKVIQEAETTIQKRYWQHGKGIVTIIPAEVLIATIGASTGGFFEWNYWSYQEIKKASRQSLLLNNTNFIKPFLLWAMNHYIPSQEVILLLCGFPVNQEQVTGTLEELASNRCYAIWRSRYSTAIN